ncbi:MAG: hypothetical protein ACOCVK_02710 [bacterium]
MTRLIACVSLLLLLTATLGFAENGVDHPLVGRFEGAEIQKQEISRFGEYTIALGEEETQTVQGEVWMTLYNAPDDASTFSVYSTYLSFLEQEGFEILLAYEPGDTPGGYLRTVYGRGPFADHGNYNHSAPITNGNDATAAYIAARSETSDREVYVSIAIKAGWNRYPQYKLDVVETSSDSGRIVVEDGADHPLVGRYEGAAIQHQEVSRFGEYTIAVSEEKTQTIEGEVWMTLYNAPERTSTYSIYATYLSFLERDGFDILLSHKPGETPGGYVKSAYERAPFADHGNYNHSAPITNGNDEVAAYIAARKETPDGEVYVSIAINAGWDALPQYKLDVAVSGSDAGKIVSSGTSTADEPDEDVPSTSQTEPAGEARGRDQEGSGASAPATGADASPALLGSGSFRLRGGALGFVFLDPAFAGALSLTTEDGTNVDVASDGLKNVHGFFVEPAWFLNPNVGLALNLTRLLSAVEFTDEGDLYKSSAELAVFRLSAISRMVGDDYPSTVGVGFGGGVAYVDLRQEGEIEGEEYYRRAEDLLPVISVSSEAAIPVFDFAHLTAGAEYLFIPFDELTMAHPDGPFSRTYHEGNLGGLTLQLGLVVEL